MGNASRYESFRNIKRIRVSPYRDWHASCEYIFRYLTNTLVLVGPNMFDIICILFVDIGLCALSARSRVNVVGVIDLKFLCGYWRQI